MNVRLNRTAALCGLGLFAVTGLPMQAAAQDAVTPSHVYQITSDLISEIEILRDAMGVTVYPVEAEPAEDRSPIHAYAKSLEVLEKISASQKRMGIKPARIAQIPVKEITPKDVYKSVQNCIAEVRRMKDQLVIEEAIQPAPLDGGITPSLVYEHLGDASYLLDGLVGHPTDPNDVHTHMVYLHDEMELIAAKLKVALELEAPPVNGRKRMKEVAQQVLRATFKVVNLQTRLGMDGVGHPAGLAGAGVSGPGLRGHQHPAGGDGADQGASGHRAAAHRACPVAEQEAAGRVRAGAAAHQEPGRPRQGGGRLRGVSREGTAFAGDRQVHDGTRFDEGRPRPGRRTARSRRAPAPGRRAARAPCSNGARGRRPARPVRRRRSGIPGTFFRQAPPEHDRRRMNGQQE